MKQHQFGLTVLNNETITGKNIRKERRRITHQKKNKTTQKRIFDARAQNNKFRRNLTVFNLRKNCIVQKKREKRLKKDIPSGFSAVQS